MWWSSRRPLEKKNVIVLGGGYCGCKVASDLASDQGLSVTIVDVRPFLWHKIAGLRCSVDSEWSEICQIPRNIKGVQVVVGRALEIKENSVLVKLESNNEESLLEFDALVCATGSNNLSPGEPPIELDGKKSIDEWYASLQSEIKLAKHIAVIGGGAVGIEQAGEIKELYSEKRVTLVHSGKELMSSDAGPCASFRQALVSGLEQIGVTVKLATKTNLSEEQRIYSRRKGFVRSLNGTVDLSDGSVLDADLVLMCIGSRPNNEMYPSDWLDERGFLKVRPSLQLESKQNIFAAGDIAGLDEDKTAVRASLQVPVVVANVRATLKAASNNESPRLSTYPNVRSRIMTVFVVPIGRSRGATQLPIKVFGGWVTGKIKGESLFVGKTYYELGNKPPCAPGPRPCNVTAGH